MGNDLNKNITIPIGEHYFVTPEIPAHKDILFHDKKKADQYWTRQTDLPKIFYDWHNETHSFGVGVELDAKKTEYHPDSPSLLISLSKEDTALLFGKAEDGKEGYQVREYRRRKEGVWFYNNGEPTYLTGDHYAALQWLPMLGCDNEIEPGSMYGQYLEFQRDTCYFFKLAEETNLGFGGLMVKPKKTGITQLLSCICLNRAMINRQKNIRMMSITEAICKEINFKFIAYSIEGVPPILMPTKTKQNESEVLFGPPASSKRSVRKTKEQNLDYLYNWLCTVPTARTAFDSATNYIALIDEFPKIKDSTYPKELFEATLVAVREGSKRKGTVFGLSYVPEISNRSFREAKELFINSKLKTVKKNEEGEYVGHTKSELICYTLLVQQGIFGCCDKYGKPIEAKVWGFINNEKEKAKDDPDKLQAIKRQYPSSENDPWQHAISDDSLYDIVRLEEQMEYLLDRYSTGDLPYETYNLRYEFAPVKKPRSEQYEFRGKILIDQVTNDDIMDDKPLGLYKWYDKQWTPEWYLQKHLGNITVNEKNGLLQPNPNSPFFLAMDPTGYRSKKYTGKGSMNSLQAFIMPDAELNAWCGENTTNYRQMIEYHYRQDKPSETMQDVIRLLLFLGCYFLLESNQATWAEDLIEMGLGNFLLMINEEGGLEPWNPHRKQSLFEKTTANIDQMVNATQEHLGAARRPEDIDNIKYIKSYLTCKQLTEVTKLNMKEYDVAVCYQEAIMGMKGYQGWKRAQEERNRHRGDGGIRAAVLKIR